MAELKIGTGSGGWGPATTISVLITLAIVAGGIVQLTRGDMTWEQYQMALLFAGGQNAVVGVGRGIAYGGQGTGFGKKGEVNK